MVLVCGSGILSVGWLTGWLLGMLDKLADLLVACSVFIRLDCWFVIGWLVGWLPRSCSVGIIIGTWIW